MYLRNVKHFNLVSHIGMNANTFPLLFLVKSWSNLSVNIWAKYIGITTLKHAIYQNTNVQPAISRNKSKVNFAVFTMSMLQNTTTYWTAMSCSWDERVNSSSSRGGKRGWVFRGIPAACSREAARGGAVWYGRCDL